MRRERPGRALVTGGAGFIGSTIVERLLWEDFDVTVLDDFSGSDGGNLSSVARRIRLLKASVLDKDALQEAVKAQDVVFHLAGNTSVNRSLEEPGRSAEENILGTVRLLEAASRSRVRRFVYSSSAAVYGQSKERPSKESQEIVPASPYALEKKTGEEYMRLFSRLSQIDTVSLRYFNVFGPRQNADVPHPGGVTIVVFELLERGVSQVFDGGRQTRDMIYVDDVARANLLAMKAKGRLGGAVFNVCTGRAVTVQALHKGIARALGTKPAFSSQPLPKGNVIHSKGDPALASKRLGFKAEVSLEEGLKRTVSWCLLERVRGGGRETS